MIWEQTVQYASISDIGLRRRNNQDACTVQVCSEQEEWQRRGHLFMVADGMGGHAVGELASKIAVDTAPHTFYKSQHSKLSDALRESIETANHAIHERGTHNRDFERMGTTCSTLVLGPEGAVIGHVGDSRIYRVSQGTISQLTFDHSLQWELIRQGRMKPEDVYLHQPRNVITRSLGPEPEVDVDIEGPWPVDPGDTFVLCSDGLTGHVADMEIGAIAGSLEPAESCRLLVNLANLRGGSDNITVLVVRVCKGATLGEGQPAEESEVQTDGPGWIWLIRCWILALSAVLGLAAMLFNWPKTGGSLLAISVVTLMGMTWRWWKQRRKSRGAGTAHARKLNVYRSTPARLTRKFLSHLAALEAELQRSAMEEGWTLDWDEHRSADHEAKEAVANHQFVRAFNAYGRMLDVFMAGVQVYRKQKDHETKWGKSDRQNRKT